MKTPKVFERCAHAALARGLHFTHEFFQWDDTRFPFVRTFNFQGSDCAKRVNLYEDRLHKRCHTRSDQKHYLERVGTIAPFCY
jgi:hypothetical protein